LADGSVAFLPQFLSLGALPTWSLFCADCAAAAVSERWAWADDDVSAAAEARDEAPEALRLGKALGALGEFRGWARDVVLQLVKASDK
jgi:hypothetical protein